MGKIYLASQSQSRQALLDQARIPYQVVASSFCDDDIQQESENIYDHVTMLARGKGNGVDLSLLEQEGSYVIVAADTLIQTVEANRFLVSRLIGTMPSGCFRICKMKTSELLPVCM